MPVPYSKLKGHLSPFCAWAAVWFLILRKTFQSWYMWEKSFSIGLMSSVEIVIPILKICLVGHDLLKWHILFLEFKTVAKIRCPRKRIFKAARDESYFIWSTLKKRQEDEDRKLIKLQMWMQIEESKTVKAFTQLNIMNSLCKQKLKSRQMNIFERHVKLQANSWHSW